jgi:hypothetical protein
MKLLKKESLEINFPILPIPNNIKDENEFEDITYIQGKSWISLKNFLLFSYEPFWNGYLILARRIADLIHMTIKNALLGYHY